MHLISIISLPLIVVSPTQLLKHLNHILKWEKRFLVQMHITLGLYYLNLPKVKTSRCQNTIRSSLPHLLLLSHSEMSKLKSSLIDFAPLILCSIAGSFPSSASALHSISQFTNLVLDSYYTMSLNVI